MGSTELLVQPVATLYQSQQLSILPQPAQLEGLGSTKVTEKGSGKHCIVHRGYVLFQTLIHGEFPVTAEKTVKPHDDKTVKTLNKGTTEIPA